MKLAVIGHQDAVWGFSLVGVQGYITESVESFNKALDTVLTDRNIGIVLITEDMRKFNPERVNALKFHTGDGPLIIEIPGPGAQDSERPDLAKVIQQTTGVQV